ncbi:putative Peptidyl-tRNA hydrolase [Candidatus Propionivibrio aalborgensis]|uniref:Putative Peptidyl-tRNA hydrolase n=1 Tax=Candidatus Propionivibrio aalborgensis TaxID=1860101 RepID=A0A1A8XNN4_9RHOO|nr:aminoacyl-tRNA hydrolase [Candidatus Propionivibrio aalborgensis]SBT06779.1 putative Peptidyl-tRNA hydrolase [Candidatus Propionivibrio aalborgensis]
MRSVPYMTFIRVRNALAWRFRRIVGDARLDRAIVKIAWRWRPLLKKPVFIGIAGSAGKTTTKELLLGVLSHKGRGAGNPASLNALPEVAKTVLRVRPTHDFCVVELSEDKPGILDAPLALLQPDIGIVTVIGNDHRSAFSTHEGIAGEVGKLIASLPSTGTAVLNADDPLVIAMAAHSAARVMSYGLSPHAELRAEEISSDWPDRLQMTLVYGTERVKIRTRLCGTHWVPSVLGAIGGGLATGMTLAECAVGIANVAPFDGRMQPLDTPEGVTFIRDDFKPSLWTFEACFDFMKVAQAKRKIIVIGEISDVIAAKEVTYKRIAIRAQEICDVTIFVGQWASSALTARQPGENEKALRAFSHVRDAAEYVNSITREGDLVLLKGGIKKDHLLRIILARSENIACWRDDCARDSFCNECPHRSKPSGLAALQPATSITEIAAPFPSTLLRPIEADEQVIVGLGNPEARYAGTPHNVGYEVVDQLAASLGLTWEVTPEAWIARGSSPGRAICLIKIRMAMNLTGAGLKKLSDTMAFSPEQCIFVFDDLDLPLGTVRTRPRGSAGGHRGVASILEAFQTDAFRRVKVGVGHASAKLDRVKYVLTAFDEENRTIIDQAILTAEARLLEMIGPPSIAKGH